MSEYASGFSLSALDAGSWRKNISIHIPVAGAARPWVCRGFSRPLLAVLPNSRFVRDFAADAESMRRWADVPRVSCMPEIAIASYSSDPAALEAQKAARGEVMQRWRETEGVMLASPGALMGPISLGGDRLELDTGPGVSRSRLIEWLSGHGYERSDIVWSPGQFTWRGGIVDFFDPGAVYPVRVEFFDDDIESMRYFATDTQRSVRNMDRAEIRALTSRRDSRISDFYPGDMHVVFIEPSELENAGENYSWLMDGIGIKKDGDDAPPVWRDIEKGLFFYPRVRITSGAARADVKTGLIGLPNFRGRRRDLEAYCDGMTSRGVSVFVVSDAEHFSAWASGKGYGTSGGSISEGFYDPAGRRIFIGDLELSGMAVSGSSAEARVPLDWDGQILPGQWVVHEDYGVGFYRGSEQIEGPGGTQEYLVLEYEGERRLKIPVMHFHKISPYRT
ncbi:MAG: hypothetical protein LBR87_08190, partial [Synergistaceae bacterium]|nr:hypothetical protein [Synergistaceae bacterium]